MNYAAHYDRLISSARDRANMRAAWVIRKSKAV